MAREAVIIVEDLVKRYGDIEAVKKVSFKVFKGEIYGLLGPNGAGKTTIFKIIAGISNPTSGRVLIFGSDPRDYRVRSKIGYCPQENITYSDLTGYENLMFYLRLYNIGGDEARRRAEHLLKMVGLWDYRNMRVRKYSGGMKSRLNIAITLAGDPDILILDEPTVGLDPNIRREIWDMINSLKEAGKTILLATHYMEEAEALCDRVGIIDNGKIIDEGAPDELKKRVGLKSILYISAVKNVGEIYNVLADLIGSDKVFKEDNVIRLYLDEPYKESPKILEELFNRGYSIESFKISPPTLEDVFIKYTGRRLE